MTDPYQAIEQLSALLFYRLERSAKKRGWATKSAAWQIAPPGGRPITVVATTLHLPRGLSGSFIPRSQPEDGGGWLIDVRRSDGVVRQSFAYGLRLMQQQAAAVLAVNDQPLSEESLGEILDDLGRPGPSGVELWIRRLWAMRFGPMPVDLSARQETIRDVDQLDGLHAAMLRATHREEAEASLRG